MTRFEIRNKIAEAEGWLTCSCTLCRIMRLKVGEPKIEEYISKLKAKLNRV